MVKSKQTRRENILLPVHGHLTRSLVPEAHWEPDALWVGELEFVVIFCVHEVAPGSHPLGRSSMGNAPWYLLESEVAFSSNVKPSASLATRHLVKKHHRLISEISYMHRPALSLVLSWLLGFPLVNFHCCLNNYKLGIKHIVILLSVQSTNPRKPNPIRPWARWKNKLRIF